MITSFALSLAAMDILWERLELGPPPFPFEVPHNGRTREERASIRDAVHANLRGRNLMAADRLDPHVEGALRALAQPEVALTVFGSLDGGAALLARVVRTAESAILAVLVGQTVRFEHIRPGTIVQAMVGLIPEERPGRGRQVTLSLDAAEPSGPAEARERAEVAAIFARPRIRVGQFGITVRGRHGREHRGSEVGWFDTDVGRYCARIHAGADGRRLVTCGPADRARLGELLGNHLAAQHQSASRH